MNLITRGLLKSSTPAMTFAPVGSSASLARASAKLNIEMALLADGVAPKAVYEVLSTPQGVARALQSLREQDYRDFEVIVTDAQANARLWTEALNLGAYDLLAQPFYEPEVRRILHNACSRPAYSSAGA